MIATTLLTVENTLNELANVVLKKSVTNGDAYCKLADKVIDLMEGAQVCRKMANGIELDEEADEVG